MKPEELVQKIEAQVAGLNVQSEIDAGLQVKFLPEVEASRSLPNIFAISGFPTEDPISEISADEFLAPLSEAEDWMGEDELANARGFLSLQKTLNAELEDIRVLQSGDREKTILIIGKPRDFSRGLLVLSTRTVET